MQWLGIPVGKIILKVVGIEDILGTSCYHITADAAPNKFFATFYDVQYTVHTYMNKNTFLPVRFEKTRRIKDKSTYVRIDFDRRNHKAEYRVEGDAPFVHISELRDKMDKEKPTSSQILHEAQDLFSSFYYLRLLRLKEGGSYTINIYYAQRSWPVQIKIGTPFLKEFHKKPSKVLFPAYMTSQLNDFILGKRSIVVYFTADSKRIPIEFQMGTGIGALHGLIQNLPE